MVAHRLSKVVIAILALAAVAAASTIPASTRVTVRLTSEISSGRAQTGQGFEGTVASDVVVNSKTVAKAGAAVRGKVTHLKPSGR